MAKPFITDPHVKAELAAAHGEVELLADYFRVEKKPSPEVVKAISRHLDGSDNWKIDIVTRTGRPPKKSLPPGSVLAIGQERALSARLFILGEALTARSLQGAELQLMANLAEAFSSAGKGKFKLVYRHRRKGNPATHLRKQIKTAILGLTANKLYLELGNWRAVDDRLAELGLSGFDDAARKKAVQFVNRAKK